MGNNFQYAIQIFVLLFVFQQKFNVDRVQCSQNERLKEMRKTGRCPEGEMVKGEKKARIGAGIVLEDRQVINSQKICMQNGLSC